VCSARFVLRGSPSSSAVVLAYCARWFHRRRTAGEFRLRIGPRANSHLIAFSCACVLRALCAARLAFIVGGGLGVLRALVPSVAGQHVSFDCESDPWANAHLIAFSCACVLRALCAARLAFIVGGGLGVLRALVPSSPGRP